MTYFDRLVENPDAALKDIAARRKLSLDELHARIGDIYTEARSGKHLSLGDAMRWLEAPEAASRELRSHIDGCRYCQALVDGLAPARLKENIGRLQAEIESRGTSRLLPRLVTRVREWIRYNDSLVEVGLAAGVVGLLVGIAVPALQYPHIARNTPQPLLPSAFTASTDNTEIAGVVSANCTLLTTATKSATIVCVKPRSERSVHVDVTGDHNEEGWTLTSASSQSDGANSRVVDFGQPFFARNALRPGDEVLVFNAQRSGSADSVKAVADSLAALKESVRAKPTSNGKASAQK